MTSIENIFAVHRAIKQEYPTSIVLLKVDDFYEAFDNDAHLLHKILDISLTSTETKHVPSAKAQFAITALEGNLVKLLKDGYSVAVCSY